MTRFIDDKKIPSDLPANGIIVFIYLPNPDNQTTYKYLVFTDKDSYSVEELCVLSAKKLSMKPPTIPLLGLVSVKHERFWPAYSRYIKVPPSGTTQYILRVRYRLPSHKVKEIWEYNPDMIMYLFWQMLDDLVNDRIPNLEEKSILGYSSTAVFCTTRNEDKTVDYMRFVPFSVRKQYSRPDKSYQLKLSLKKCVKDIQEDYKQKKQLDSAKYLVLDVLKNSESYMCETYDVTSQHGGKKKQLIISEHLVTIRTDADNKGKIYQVIIWLYSLYSCIKPVIQSIQLLIFLAIFNKL